ncbi:aminoglycoside phosphotransferase family protein [Pontivivens ytuae]|uniref:Aminoglycoside phosphotransferase family protein n=1 Tax=Pontivivens ytuae TaxID=2789856 RepID=A0A7S9LNY0_9RHOB|nr:aminoglycoside phosphotransferase family protein [Pontivivens ytuae]QPH52607.1 aminoglycoside phosphotransferase family protein [Pontivivens ytuae]
MTSTTADAATTSLAAELAGRAGLLPPASMERLSGGKNNRVYLLRSDSGSDSVLKVYFSDKRDRLGAEWRFLTYAQAHGIACVPKPLAKDTSAGAALYTFLPGQKRSSSATSEDVAEAARLIVSLNPPSEAEADAMGPGSEACFTIGEHLASVARRVERLRALDVARPYVEQAVDLVTDRLAPIWRQVAASTLENAKRAGIDIHAPLVPAERVISPSDFGFHNALVHNNTLNFLDFEYAGMDDPAKLVGDFFAVPEIPAPQDCFDVFVSALSAGLALGAAFEARAAALRDVYRVKWACIILNDFLPEDAARRDFALGTNHAERCRAQIAKAHAKLDEIA